MLLAAFTFAQILSYPFPSAPVRDPKGTAIAYTLNTQGVRTIWFARAPEFAPRQLFASDGDDGQELSDLAISADDAHVVYVRGGDHDANWPEPLQPGPASNPQQPEMQVWSVSTHGGLPKLLGAGDAPAISPDGARVAFTDGGAVMIAPIEGSAAAKRLFFDRGQDSELQWSPDGSALAFISDAHGPQLHRNLSQRCVADCVSRADHVARFHAALVTRRHARRLYPHCTATAARRRIR